MLYDGGFFLYKIKDEDNSISSFTISNIYKNFFNETFLHLLNPAFYEGNNEYTNYWLSSNIVKYEIENKYKQPEIQEKYSIMDALDSDPSAIWNID